MRTMILSVMASFLLFSAQAQEDKNVLVNQQGNAYAVSAPDGWLANNDVASEMGLGAAFHLEGTVWENTAAFIFVNTTSLVGSGDNIYDLIGESDNWKENDPITIKIKRAGVEQTIKGTVKVPFEEKQKLIASAPRADPPHSHRPGLV